MSLKHGIIASSQNDVGVFRVFLPLQPVGVRIWVILIATDAEYIKVM